MRPVVGASQHTSWRGSHRYRPYDRQDRKPIASYKQASQQQNQPWRQFSRSRSRGRGRGHGSNPRFSKVQAYKPYKWQLLCGSDSSVGLKISKQDYAENSGQFGYTDNKQFSGIRHFKSSGCVLSCCKLCSYCSFIRVSTKERSKYRSLSEQNKACQRCFLYKSFCPSCSQCPQCCRRTDYQGTLTTVWAYLARNGANPRVVSVMKDGYSLPFSQRPLLTRVPLVHSGYANPTKSRSLKESLLDLIGKRAVEKVVIKSSLAFYNRLFLVPKLNRKWRPILDLSQLNLYLKASSFKMETPETIRLSLQTGEWVTSSDFSDAYFHIPINSRLRKYLRFSLNKQTFQFTALPFGLATAPLEFTKVVKEVKLMAQARGIWIHQYLDDWLLRAQSQETCLQDTQTLLALCQKLGWVVNMRKSELDPQQIFNFVGYRDVLIWGRFNGIWHVTGMSRKF